MAERQVAVGRGNILAEGHPEANHQNIVSAGESVAGEDVEQFSSDDSEEIESRAHKDPNDDLYDENLDDEDEAYVYKHMRGGTQQSVTVRRGNEGPSEDHISTPPNDRQQEKKKMMMYKPRTSDAVLSCPCCFNIVCMDCQKHKKYANQYRAMFVMGVVVDWNHVLVYDEENRSLITKTSEAEISELSSIYQDSPWLQARDGEYYAVECATCNTQVAALDMNDEVYYFHGCLESSSAI